MPSEFDFDDGWGLAPVIPNNNVETSEKNVFYVTDSGTKLYTVEFDDKKEEFVLKDKKTIKTLFNKHLQM